MDMWGCLKTPSPARGPKRTKLFVHLSFSLILGALFACTLRRQAVTYANGTTNFCPGAYYGFLFHAVDAHFGLWSLEPHPPATINQRKLDQTTLDAITISPLFYDG